VGAPGAGPPARAPRQTRERAAEIGLDVHVLPEWYDVDDVASMQTLRGEVIEGRAFASNLRPAPAAHAAALLGSLLARTDLAQRLDRGANPIAMRAAE
jgi:hypothetical protein